MSAERDMRPNNTNNNNNNNNKKPVSFKKNERAEALKKWLRSAYWGDMLADGAGLIFTSGMWIVCILSFIGQLAGFGIVNPPIFVTAGLGIMYVLITRFQMKYFIGLDLIREKPAVAFIWTLFTLWDIGGIYTGLKTFLIGKSFALAFADVLVKNDIFWNISFFLLSCVLAFITEIAFVYFFGEFVKALNYGTK